MGAGDEILGLDDLKREPVEVPEWRRTVWVREFTGEQRDAFEAMVGLVRDGKAASVPNVRGTIVCWTAADESGQRLFTDDQAAAVGGKSFAALDRLFGKAIEINKLAPDAVEELEGNSDNGQNGSSGTA